ncbi:MAG TPA: FAD-binding oxidoreductase [Flavobacterium sp.]|jgi:ferredoxin-NADP reductase|uniref:FAD-binding oxidoreductase n=1 Tax=Flavobacterium sp. TaxID=239 RepID=UPI002CFF5D1F|nr:FAD-binding oxidoreductase [Flavobacterium sp.]MCA0350112.1 flavodoxin reductase [Bacteroidota bacterium]HPW98565.1 FAD-binding oxidoreductase [Flavobacterium sp.]HQA74247.1 FAD-binding oxidoreductase [Flavobacterium sp.]
MSAHIVKVLEARFITHDVKRFKVEKPEGYDFIPGQATVVSINLPEWKDEIRPFTFTNLRDAKYLEFMIKIYSDHNGVTKLLGKVNAGDELIIHDVFGAIHYEKPGVFIAAGSGITPFISIFRDLYNKNALRGNRLIYVNKTMDDIIMGEELFRMLKKDFVNVLTRQNVIGYRERRIDRNYLIENIIDFSQHFYVCGPDDFVKEITTILLDLGAKSESLIFEV